MLSEAATLQILGSIMDPTRVSLDPLTRMAYSRDASPLALKAAADGVSTHVPRAVTWPETTQEVRALVRAAARLGATLVPWGGGSGIVGGALAGTGSIVVDMKRMDRIIDIDPISMTVTVEAGILGAVLEDRLNARGLTCGHFPQSMQSSTVGGWLAHRGAGAFSTKYGRVEDLVLSIEVVLPDGQVLHTRAVPASAAGPDLGALFLGAEGTLGVVVSVVMQVFPAPEARLHRAFAVGSFSDGLEAVRGIVQRGLRPAVVRLYDPTEARDRFPSLVSDGTAVLLLLAEGDAALTDFTLAEASRSMMTRGARDLGTAVGERWLAERTSTATLCRRLATAAGVADALEVANVWSRLSATYEGMMRAMEGVVGPAGRVYGHASHFYPSGGNLYLIFEADAPDPAAVAPLYRSVLAAAFEACHAEGGTLTHHHGVGPAKDAWLAREWGEVGLAMWRTVRQAIDPAGLMNPGTLRG